MGFSTLASFVLALAPTGDGARPATALAWVQPAGDALRSPSEHGDGAFTTEWIGDVQRVRPAGRPTAEHALARDPMPGLLYVAMDGVTLTPSCEADTHAHSAQNCTSLVDRTVQVPPFGSDSDRQELLQRLRQYYSSIDLTITSQRPPAWFPYTMVTVGGGSDLARVPGVYCGIANVGCDGTKRNSVSMAFPGSCGAVAETIAHETSHSWGLEHTSDAADWMFFTQASGARSFKDACMGINEPNGSMCPREHENYCGAGQQNSHAELLGVFGAPTEDTQAPEVAKFFPPQGATVGSEDRITISAQLAENSPFLGVRWQWVEGLPDGVAAMDRCTNDVCFDSYQNFLDPNETAWDFLTLGPGIPVGEYAFELQAMDAHGNGVSETLRFTVVEGETPAGELEDGGEEDDHGASDGGSEGAAQGGEGGCSATLGAAARSASGGWRGPGPLAWAIGFPVLLVLGPRRRV